MTALSEPFLLRAWLALGLFTSIFGGEINGSVTALSQVTGVISSCLIFMGFFNFGLLRSELEKERLECFFSLSLEVEELEL